MKKLLFALLTVIIVMPLNASFIMAATPIPTSADSSDPTTPPASVSAQQSVGEKLNQQINQLKERIASKVAELNLVEKRGTIGTVTDTSGNQVTFTDFSGKTRYIDVDEITKFSSPSAKNGFGLSDLTKGTQISVLGLYNKQSQRILARFINGFVTPIYLSGRIADIDKKNFTVTMISEDQKQTKIDIETLTNISAHSKADGISKLGFSKLTNGDKVIVTGFPDKKDPALLVASRILVLPELPQNPKIIIAEPTDITTPTITKSQDTTTSSSSGKKQTPTPTQ
jgi:hypothetical protein